MTCACTGYSAGKNLRSFRHEAAKSGYILVIDNVDLVYAECANLLAALASASAVISFDLFSHSR